MRQIDKIVIHCSATKAKQKVTVEDIRQWHLKRGFRDIGYHWVIYQDGSLHKGRPEEQIGAHVQGYNNHSIGICYVGGIGEDGKPADTRTPQQKETLYKLLRELHKRYPQATVHGHNEFANKACPSFKVIQEDTIVKIFGMMSLFFLFIMLAGTLTGCQTSKHATSKVSQEMQTTQVSAFLGQTFSMDSVVQSLVADADSVSVCYQLPAVRTAASSGGITNGTPPDEPLSPVVRITAHRPHIRAERKSSSSSNASISKKDSCQTAKRDTAATTTDKDTVAIVKPANSITTIITCALVGTGALILLLVLRKKKII